MIGADAGPTLFDLTSWRDAATTGQLPAPSRPERWQPVRAGVVNLWEYDAAEVWYADGRLQLQGANESGKSTLMMLTTLLLLAGDISSHNIDTLGQSEKRFRYYVEPTGHALDRRDATPLKNRGWAWLEFGRGTEYFTLLLFAESRRADNALKVHWCTVHGQARVRDGLVLNVAGVVAEPSQFRDLAGFTVHRSGAAYREEIARLLFGRDTSWLDQVIRILRVVRTPQIGNRLDLRFLTNAFRVALPPLASDEIGQLADGWEQLQRLRDERDTTDQALSAVSEFSRQRWRPWADAVIRAAADPVTHVTSSLDRITRDERKAAEALTGLEKEVTGLETCIADEEEASRLATAQREALRTSQTYQDAMAAAQNAEQLAVQAASAANVAERSRNRAEEASKAIGPAGEWLSQATNNLGEAEREVDHAAGQVTDGAQNAGLAEITAQYLPGRDTDRLHQAARLKAGAATEARRLIGKQAEVTRVHDAAVRQAREAQGKAAAAQRAVATAESAVEEAITQVVRALSRWTADLDERIRPAPELVEDWSRQVSGLIAADPLAPVLALAVSQSHLNPVRRPLDGQRAELARSLRDNEKAREKAEEKRAQVTAERDPRPRDPEFWLRRERPEGISATGAPLWRLVETTGPEIPAATVEAALDAAGLLQAWVTPDGTHLPGRDGSDIVWAGPAEAGEPDAGAGSLRAVLRPADDAGLLAGVVSALLASVRYGPDLPAGSAAIGADGRWRYGGLTGLAAPSPDGPRLLGAAARAADRARRLEALRAELTRLTQEHDRLAGLLTETEDLLAALGTAAEKLPSDSAVVAAVLRARQAADTAEEAAGEAERLAEAEHAAAAAVDTATARVAAHCTEHFLPHGQAEVEAALQALALYQSRISALVSALRVLPSLRDTVSQAEKTLSDKRSTYEREKKEAGKDTEGAAELAAKADTARAALTQETQQIVEEVRQLGKRIEAAGRTLKALADDRVKLVDRRATARATLEAAAGKREEAEAERERCVNRWLNCVDSGLPRLRDLADPPARHVTGALESARAARAKISIRDWPDEPGATAQREQRVQNQWGRMTEAVAMLRSRLEALAGRTVRTRPPGDGADDFPGAVEIVVDATGAALAPPVAVDTLSAMLLRLQSDYDDELTKAINELLGSTFIEHLRDRLTEAERLRSDINGKLAENPTSVSGLMLRLVRVPVSEERAANEVLAALERDFSLLPGATQDQLRNFLAGRVSEAQEKARAAGDPDWRARLAEILDYRRWFDLQMEYRTARSGAADSLAGGWRTLNRGDHGLLSGGAKVVTLMQPFIAALHAMYDQSGIGPRMIWLDEAFGGVDSANRATMFRLLTSCDLDWLIAGPGIIANSSTVPLASIYEVRRAPLPLPGVSLELALWSGSELTHIVTPDPADLPSLSADVPATAPGSGDDLFADL